MNDGKVLGIGIYMSAVIKGKSTISPHTSVFNNFEVVSQSWYLLSHSKRLRKGQVKTFERLGRKLAVYRDELGKVHAFEAHCPHFGANLGQGKVKGRELECPFHHWRFDTEGKCSYAPNIATPKRHTKSYPVLEKWGVVWFFNGRIPFISLPELPEDGRYTTIWLPKWQINCHPHLAIGNNLDVNHFETLHNFRLTEEPALEYPNKYSLRLKLQGQFKDKYLQRLIGTKNQNIEAEVLTLGGNLAWFHIKKPFDFYILLTGSPRENKGCYIQTFVFVPKGQLKIVPQVIVLLFAFLKGDSKILSKLNFTAGFTENDEIFREFVSLVNRLPVG